MDTRVGRTLAVCGILAMAATACGSSSKSSSSTSSSSKASTSAGNTASAPGITPTTITLGYITSVTGVASSTFADGPDGAQARVDLQNAEGGVDGRKLILVSEDDQSTPAQDATASQVLVQDKNVFGIIDYSSFTFGGAKYLEQQGVPVTGFEFDGPEWGEQPYTNMFSFIPPTETPFDGTYYTYTFTGKLFKDIGVTKVAGLGYGISPSSQESIKAMFASAATQGVQKCYENESVPFGGVDFTADVLAIKSSGCNGVVGSFVDASDIALNTAAKNAGINSKNLFFTGYDNDVLSSPSSSAAFNDAYVESQVSFSPSIPGVATMLNAFKTYYPKYTPGALPDFGLYGSYMGADLMIKGLQVAGKNPTRQSFITNLRKVTDYTADGILPAPTSFTGFGTAAMMPQSSCDYFFQLVNGKFDPVPSNGKPVCGTRVPFKL